MVSTEIYTWTYIINLVTLLLVKSNNISEFNFILTNVS